MMAKGPKKDERRQEERLPVKIRFEYRGEKMEFNGKTSDLSKSGLSFFCDFNVTCKKCKIELWLPSRQNGEPHISAIVDARIAYSVLSGEKGFKVGIEFKRFHGDAKTLICRELAYCQITSVEALN